MKCPHCLVSFHDEVKGYGLGRDATTDWNLLQRTCPSCKKFIITLNARNFSGELVGLNREFYCYPKNASRTPLGSDVPEQFAADYLEACLVLSDSPKASAALSRRCLQHLLREKGGVKAGNLSDEIQEVIDSGKLPTYLSESLEAVRKIGNFAAHPIKSKSSGEIIDVEPGEAEWNLDVIEALFDFYLVRPALLKRKKEAFNAKLKEAGKPEMK